MIDDLFARLPADPTVQGDVQRASFMELEPEIRAYAAPLLPINVKLELAAKLILGCWERLTPFHGEITRLTGMSQRDLESLPKLAYALLHLNAATPERRTGRKELRELHRAAMQVRGVLVSTYRTLGVCGLMELSPLKNLEGPLSYDGCANDLTALAASLREAWPRIEGKQPLTLENLTKAAELGARLSKGKGEEDHGSVPRSELSELKQRTFTLLATRYDQVRRAMSFLRWNEGDSEKLAPSLYIGRNNGGRKKRAHVEEANAGNVAAEGQGATLAGEAQAASAGGAHAPGETPGADGGSAGEDTGDYARAALDTLLPPPPVVRTQEPSPRAAFLHQEAGAFTPKFLQGS